MTPLEKRRKEIELMRVQTAKHEILFRIEERLDEIERLKDHVKVQEQAEEKLKLEISKL